MSTHLVIKGILKDIKAILPLNPPLDKSLAEDVNSRLRAIGVDKQLRPIVLPPKEDRLSKKIFEQFLEWGELTTNKTPEEMFKEEISLSPRMATRVFQELAEVARRTTEKCDEPSSKEHDEFHIINNACSLMLFGIYLSRFYEEGPEV